MPTVFLVRHGSTDGMRERLIGRSDVGLNKYGRIESARAAEACRRLGVGIVASSPSRRARETAEIIAESIGCGVKVVDASRRDACRDHPWRAPSGRIAVVVVVALPTRTGEYQTGEMA